VKALNLCITNEDKRHRIATDRLISTYSIHDPEPESCQKGKLKVYHRKALPSEHLEALFETKGAVNQDDRMRSITLKSKTTEVRLRKYYHAGSSPVIKPALEYSILLELPDSNEVFVVLLDCFSMKIVNVLLVEHFPNSFPLRATKGSLHKEV
jgi:hypothetical protein